MGRLIGPERLVRFVGPIWGLSRNRPSSTGLGGIVSDLFGVVLVPLGGTLLDGQAFLSREKVPSDILSLSFI